MYSVRLGCTLMLIKCVFELFELRDLTDVALFDSDSWIPFFNLHSERARERERESARARERESERDRESQTMKREREREKERL